MLNFGLDLSDSKIYLYPFIGFKGDPYIYLCNFAGGDTKITVYSRIISRERPVFFSA